MNYTSSAGEDGKQPLIPKLDWAPISVLSHQK